MPWQEIMAGLVVALACVYVIRKFRGKKSRRHRPGGPDVPLSRLTRKPPPSDSCDH